MIEGRCPICSKRFAIASLDDLPCFPFCSERCRLVDLGRWIDGSYSISEKSPADDELQIPSGDDEEAD